MVTGELTRVDLASAVTIAAGQGWLYQRRSCLIASIWIVPMTGPGAARARFLARPGAGTEHPVRPDSNAVVPSTSPRFAGEFALDSQGDQRQIYAHGLSGDELSVLNPSQSVDDTQWITAPGSTLYAAEGGANEVVAVHGDFNPGTAFTAATPGDSNNAPAHPPANFLGTINFETGTATPVPGVSIQPNSLVHIAGS